MTRLKNTLQDNVQKNVATVEVLGLMKVVSATVLPSKNNAKTAENYHILHQCADQALSQTQELHSINRANNNLAHTTSANLTWTKPVWTHHQTKKVRVMLHLSMQRMLTQTSFHILLFSFKEKTQCSCRLRSHNKSSIRERFWGSLSTTDFEIITIKNFSIWAATLYFRDRKIPNDFGIWHILNDNKYLCCTREWTSQDLQLITTVPV